MRSSPPVETFVPPAILELLLVISAGVVAAISASSGFGLQCTALLEFSTLSTITAASAALRCTRYAMQTTGLLVRWQRCESYWLILRLTAYAGLALYAITNGVLDVSLPRHDSDPVSYSALGAAVVAMLVFAIVVEIKYRLLQREPSRSLFESLCDDAFYIGVSVLTVAALLGHVFAAVWWLDTLMDAVVTALAASRIQVLLNERAKANADR